MHRWSRINMPVFTPIKLLVLLDRNSNDGRTWMYRYFGVISLNRCQFWLEWILLLLGSWTQTFCILVAHENSTFQHLKFTVSVPCVFGKQVLYWILNFHRTMNWCMFVMLLKVASSMCGLFFYFCACEETKVIKAGFFLTFLEGGYQNFSLTGR